MLISAVDVGSARARAGIFASDGRLLARASHGFSTHTGPEGHAGYEFAEIWSAVGLALRDARDMAGVSSGDIRALAFDATCSLALDAPGGGPDVIAWHDHRAIDEAALISETRHPLALRAGEQMSPEMQTPKLLWLARKRPDIWVGLRGARDLCDQLALSATGAETRSLCAMATKWPYLADAGGWQEGLLTRLGLSDLPRGGAVMAPGSVIGPLQPSAAEHLGLRTDCVVAVGLIDAFAGVLGAAVDMPVLIAGTSNCVMACDVAQKPGLWGPYPDVIIPGETVTEGGQSATGAMLEAIRQLYQQPQTHEDILARLSVMQGQSELGSDIHLLPDIQGSRTPYSNAALRGVMHGMSLRRDQAALDAVYWRGLVAIAMGTRQVTDYMGLWPLRHLAMTGGQSRSALIRQLYADALDTQIHWQPEDAVLRGTAIAAAAATYGFNNSKQH